MGFEEIEKLRQGQRPSTDLVVQQQDQGEEMTDEEYIQEQLMMQAQQRAMMQTDPLYRSGMPPAYTREREIEAMDNIAALPKGEMWTVDSFWRIYGKQLGYLNLNSAMGKRFQQDYDVIVMLSCAQGMEKMVHSLITRLVFELQMTKSNGEIPQAGLTGVTKWFSTQNKSEQIVRMLPTAPGQQTGKPVSTIDKIKRAFGRG
jgi:hypothetical protein